MVNKKCGIYSFFSAQRTNIILIVGLTAMTAIYGNLRFKKAAERCERMKNGASHRAIDVSRAACKYSASRKFSISQLRAVFLCFRKKTKYYYLHATEHFPQSFGGGVVEALQTFVKRVGVVVEQRLPHRRQER